MVQDCPVPSLRSGSLHVSSSPHSQPDVRGVVSVWWPLAASWLLMSLELPLVSAGLARMEHPEIQLAAFGGIVFPLMLIVESPVIMLLAASTALSRDWASYVSLRGYMTRMGVVLTGLHTAIALTPLYDMLVIGLVDPPAAIIEPARVGVLVSIPWTWAIAYRRFNQGILIRHGASRAVGVGTIVRLVLTGSSLAIGMAVADSLPVPGVAIGTGAIIIGVVAEAAYVRARTSPVLADFFDPEADGEPLRLGEFLAFYVPLALTSLLSLLVQPIGSAAISRMPRALDSLAGWPVVVGLVFFLRSGGTAYKEVVVAMLDRPASMRALRRFTLILASVIGVLSLLFAFTPLSGLWLRWISGLAEPIAMISGRALILAVVIPIAGVLQNWYVGYLVHARKTRHITESMAIYLVVATSILGIGVYTREFTGLYVALTAFSISNLAQLGWVWWKSRAGMAELIDAENS